MSKYWTFTTSVFHHPLGYRSQPIKTKKIIKQRTHSPPSSVSHAPSSQERGPFNILLTVTAKWTSRIGWETPPTFWPWQMRGRSLGQQLAGDCARQRERRASTWAPCFSLVSISPCRAPCRMAVARACVRARVCLWRCARVRVRKEHRVARGPLVSAVLLWFKRQVMTVHQSDCGLGVWLSTARSSWRNNGHFPHPTTPSPPFLYSPPHLPAQPPSVLLA